MAENSAHTQYDDSGNVPWDTQAATIPTSGGKLFILENLDFTEPSNWAQSNNLDGSPRGGRHVAGVITGSAVALFPAGATLSDTPARFSEVSLSYRGAAKVFVINEVGTPQRSGQETKVSLKLTERLVTPSGS